MRRLVLPSLLALLALAAGAGPASAAKDLVGQVREFHLAPGARPEAIVAGPDGNLWFAGVRYLGGSGFADLVGKVTPQGEVTEYTVGTHPDNLGLSDIAVGPDGNLWFTEGGRPKVGRITPDGQITEFTLPDPAASPSSIVAGPDGNLWFAEWRGAKIGRITPSGEMTEFPLRDSAGLTVGPDGALWATGATTIARIATDGSSTSFPLPESIEYPGEIIAGPDGALWFGLQSRFGVGASPGLGRIGTDGQVSEVPVPGGRQTFALSSGPFGNLWYSNGGGRIGWIIPGVVTGDPACISSCQAPIADLTEGPDGRLWFAAGVEGGALFSTPGSIGTYAPPPLEVRILDDTELRGEKLLLPVRCRFTPAGDRCEGRLLLRGPGKPTERRLDLRIGREQRLSIRLSGAAKRRLAKRGRIVLKATTSVVGGRRDTRRIVLRQP
jgi:virginiamycin B lyase